MPRIARSVVDFPAPFGPRKAVTQPGRTVNDTRSSTVTPSMTLVASSTTISAAARAPTGAGSGSSSAGIVVGKDWIILGARGACPEGWYTPWRCQIPVNPLNGPPR